MSAYVTEKIQQLLLAKSKSMARSRSKKHNEKLSLKRFEEVDTTNHCGDSCCPPEDLEYPTSPATADVDTGVSLSNNSSSPSATVPGPASAEKPVQKKCMFIGLACRLDSCMTLANVLAKADQEKHAGRLCVPRDGACILSAGNFGFDVYSMDQKTSSHSSHFCIHTESHERSNERPHITSFERASPKTQLRTMQTRINFHSFPSCMRSTGGLF